VLKAIVKAGLQHDPVFGKLTTLKHLDASTREWIKSRYHRLCAGCGKREWTSPHTLPVCRNCWRLIPLEGGLWWWKSKRTPKTFTKLLDTYFDGGYEVAPDYHQLKMEE
jgi:hypothetical protein